ncbi:hypothetical protein GTU99_30830, partial [Streptomyces sp. PRKS01-65]
MGDYKMTEEFASAMVTVIPIILLLGGAEMLKLTKLYVEARFPEVNREVWEVLDLRPVHPETGEPAEIPLPRRESDGTAELSPWGAFEIAFAGLWGLVAVAHVYMEVRLIQWLATAGRPAAPVLAERVTWVAGAGFVMLLVGAFLPIVTIGNMSVLLRLIRKEPRLGRLLVPVLRMAARLSLINI